MWTTHLTLLSSYQLNLIYSDITGPQFPTLSGKTQSDTFLTLLPALKGMITFLQVIGILALYKLLL